MASRVLANVSRSASRLLCHPKPLRDIVSRAVAATSGMLTDPVFFSVGSLLAWRVSCVRMLLVKGR